MQNKKHAISDIIYTALAGRTDAGDKVYPFVADGEDLPNIVYRREQWDPIDHGLDYAISSKVIVNVASQNYDEAQNIMDQVIAAFDSCTHERVIAIDVIGGNEDFNSDFGAYTAEVELKIKHTK